VSFEVLIPIIIIVVLVFMKVPIWLAMVVGVVPYFLFINPSLPAHIVIQRFLSPLENASFLAIPFFITAGSIMNYSGISSRIMNLADGLVGHMTGGLAHVNVLVSTMMGGISGSCAADAALDCKILVPEMSKKGYDKEFSAAVTIASSLITPIIPPGMTLIMYAYVANASVGRMFAAGYIPGIMSCIGLMLLAGYISKKKGYKPSRQKMASFKEILKLSLESIWALILPFGIILGLRFGLFNATEAGAICIIYAILVGTLAYHELKPKHIWPIIKESLLGTGTVMILICSASVLSYFLTYERIPHMLSNWITSMNLNRITFLIVVNIILLIIGMFMEGGAPILILAPLLAPIAASFGIDIIHFGLIMVFNLCLGNMTPPFGIVLYQVSGMLGLKIGKVSRACIPFIVVMLIVLALITFIPQLTLFIPNLLYGK